VVARYQNRRFSHKFVKLDLLELSTMAEKLPPSDMSQLDVEKQEHPNEVPGEAVDVLAPERLTPIASIGASLHSVETNPYGSRPACFSSTLQECLFVLTTTMAIGQSSIFTGAAICITSRIGEALNMTAAEVTWISAAQSLAAGCFLLFFGRVADLFGRRQMFLWSMASSSASLLIIGFAKDAYYMDIFCGLSGVCSAAAVPPAIGTLGAVYSKPSRRKNRAFACFSAGNPLGFVLGAFVAGVVMLISTWRAVFWVLCIIYVIFTFIAWWTIPKDDGQVKGKFDMETLAKFDFLGAFLAVVGIAMFTGALTLANTAPQGWQTNYVIALLVIGIVLIAMFIYWQSIFKHPLMPLHVWKDRNFTLLNVILCLGFYGFSNNIFWLSLMWQRIDHCSPLQVALRLLPQAVCGLLVNFIAAMIMHRVSNKLLMIIGAVAYVASDTLISAMPAGSSWWALTFPSLVLSVLGADFEFTITNMYVMSSLPSEQQSVGGGIFNTVTRISSSLGLGMSTAVFTGLRGSTDGGVNAPFHAYQATFWVALAGAGLALLFLPFLTLKSQGAKRKKEDVSVS
jgi:MFS family permease